MPVRFEATAADNIGFGDWPRGIEERARIEAAADAAGADQVIDRLPRGYETALGMMFGEHELSGGQWRKMGLARAFLRDGTILLLDEPTANLDAAGVEHLRTELRQLRKNRAILLVSHRVEFVKDADRVLHLEQGRITQVTTAAEPPDLSASATRGIAPPEGG